MPLHWFADKALTGTLPLCALLLLAACNEDTRGAEGPATAPADAAGAVEPRARGARAVTPANWPLLPPAFAPDPELEARIATILSSMTLEEKVGQVIQADIAFVTPDDVREYNLGAVLNGGNSAPGGDARAAPQAWLDLADEFWRASTDRSDGGAGIPVLWGTDAVHGHNNIVGATIFPHNIGLGAAGDPALVRRIGEATAKEILATGMDWTFAPTVAVARDDRWGRTYESFSEAPDIVASYAAAYVQGVQGRADADGFLGDARLIATVKHFLGDGGTVGGRDQGNAPIAETALRDIHAAGYPPAIESGVQVVMASFNAYHGRKLHGHETLLNGVLRGRYGFDGFVVGDWNGHGQVAGCANVSCPASFNAGVDMFMAPDSWKELYHNTLRQARAGEIAPARLDEAVSRILRVKLRAGLFEAGPPSSRPGAGDWSALADAGHKALARRAVRESLVLLKNNDGLLPLPPGASVLVAGDGADDIGKQSGGWTYSWQGTGNANAHFPHGQSIYAGIERAMSNAGGRAVLSPDGAYEEKPDIAIVVFGEDPYAEFVGDVAHLDYLPQDGLRLLRQFKQEGVKTVAVFLSGRPLFVNPELNAADAFVAAWLPGDQGGGVADVLFADENGEARYDFAGRLSFSWPRTAIQTPLNVGDRAYDPLFPYGYGLRYAAAGENLPLLPEETGLPEAVSARIGPFLRHGDAAGVWRLGVKDGLGETQITGPVASSADRAFATRKGDDKAQEDMRVLTWRGAARFSVFGNPVDLSERSEEGGALSIRLSAPGQDEIGEISLAMECGYGCEGAVALAERLRALQGKGWTTVTVPLACFARRGARLEAVTAPFVLEADGPLTLHIAEVALADRDEGAEDCP